MSAARRDTPPAMEQSNIELARQGMREAFNALAGGDIDVWLDYFHPEAVFVLVGGFETLVGREFHGREGIRRFLEDWRATFEQVVFEVEQVLPAGERILVVVSQRTRGRAGGVETKMRWGILLSFRDGLVVRAENYYDVDDALEAAGLANGGAASEGGAL